MNIKKVLQRIKSLPDAHETLQLAFSYLDGMGVNRNLSKSFETFKLISDENDVAQNYMGYFYEKGIHVDQNHSLAFYWYNMSANQNNKLAKNNVGRCYEDGIGVSQNLTEAFKWYDQSDILYPTGEYTGKRAGILDIIIISIIYKIFYGSFILDIIIISIIYKIFYG